MSTVERLRGHEAQRDPAAEQILTDAVVASFADTPDPRLQQVLQAVVAAVHRVARELGITESELHAALDWLSGAAGDDRAAALVELTVLSDVTGLSSLVTTMTHAGVGTATAATVEGPFHRPGAPERARGESMALIDEGEPLVLSGRVCSTSGEPVPGAVLDVWHNAANGLYDLQDPGAPPFNCRGRYRTDGAGAFRIVTVRPVACPVPADGPAGALLRATSRSLLRTAHLHAIVSARGHAPVTTHVFDADDPHLHSDAVFAVSDGLVHRFVAHDDPVSAAALGVRNPYTTVDVDFVLAPLTG
ncbi:dioxygenase family protein [Geodermatophilus sp. SYSU D00766]